MTLNANEPKLMSSFYQKFQLEEIWLAYIYFCEDQELFKIVTNYLKVNLNLIFLPKIFSRSPNFLIYLFSVENTCLKCHYTLIYMFIANYTIFLIHVKFYMLLWF